MKGKVLLFSASLLFLFGGCKAEDCAVAGDEDNNALSDCADPVCAAEPQCLQAGQATVAQDNDINAQNANNATFSIFGENVQKLDVDGDGVNDVTISIVALAASDQEDICAQIPDIFAGTVPTDLTLALNINVKVELGDVTGGFANGDTLTDNGTDVVGVSATKIAASVPLLDAADGKLENIQNQAITLNNKGVFSFDNFVASPTGSDLLTASLIGDQFDFDKTSATPDTDFDLAGVCSNDATITCTQATQDADCGAGNTCGGFTNDALKLAQGVPVSISVTNAVRCADLETALLIPAP